MKRAGYGVIDTPLLEETELFVRKSGGQITGRLYSFTDPGGHRVSLRPEFTSSVIRHFIQERQELTVPVRWQYCGPVFRYEQGESGQLRQFNQLGAELVGAPGMKADAEVIWLAWEGLNRVGLHGHQLRVGHIGVLHDLLSSYRLSDPAKLFIISNMQALKSGRTNVAALKEWAEDVGLLRARFDPGMGVALEDLSNEAAQGFIQGVLRESIPAPVGRRTTEQIVERLLRKVRNADDPDTFEEAASTASELARLDGPSREVLAEARRIATSRGLQTSPFDELEGLFDALAARQVAAPQVVLDLGMARDIAYYTGVIFELMYSVDSGEVSLGGGGRYDGLIKALGGDSDVPALGFAYYVDQVVDAVAWPTSPRSEVSTG